MQATEFVESYFDAWNHSDPVFGDPLQDLIHHGGLSRSCTACYTNRKHISVPDAR